MAKQKAPLLTWKERCAGYYIEQESIKLCGLISPEARIEARVQIKLRGPNGVVWLYYKTITLPLKREK